LQDRLTSFDDLGALPPPSSALEDITATPLTRRGHASHRDINLQEDFNNSQFLQDKADEDDYAAIADDGDLDLDLELDFGVDDEERPSRIDKSVEIGRDAPAARPIEDDMFSELGLGGPSKAQNEREMSIGMDLDFGDGVQIADADGDVPMGDDDFNFGEPSVAPLDAGVSVIPDMTRARISESPLSDIDEDFAREVEMEYSRQNNTDTYEPGDDTAATIVAPQRSKKRKLLAPDEQTMLSSTLIKEQQAKRDNILKPPSFLPDPQLMALMEMQKNGGFVKYVLFDGRSDAWAPELKGLLSLDAIRPNERKRKRDSGIADMDSDQDQVSSKPRLELPEEETVLAIDGGVDVNQTLAADGTVLEMPADDGPSFQQDDSMPMPEVGTPGPEFDDTVAPLVHPAESGPISVSTKHAVHILRDIFGPEAESSADKRKKTSVVFQDLLPEKKTTKADATKMFFECLVLATKDAIKLEQPQGSLGGPIRVRGKRGLWGAWAEREAGGEAENEDEQQEEQREPEVDNNHPSPAMAPAPPTVSIVA
jgi:cohesin complex subunit SCC1